MMLYFFAVFLLGISEIIFFGRNNCLGVLSVCWVLMNIKFMRAWGNTIIQASEEQNWSENKPESLLTTATVFEHPCS